jgi:cytidylate kinase
MDETFVILTLDGGAASGKSSTGKALVERYPFLHVDTGLHYRALTLCLLQEGIEPEALLHQKKSAQESFQRLLSGIALSTQINGRTATLQINQLSFDLSSLKSPEVNRWVSPLASLPELRSFLGDYQQSLVGVAKIKGFQGIVMEGRDIGSAILPEAQYKFFLVADVKLREARRRQEGMVDDIQKRDASDSQRTTAPLVCPPGAIVLDTSQHDVKAVVEIICSYLPSDLPAAL